MIVNCDIVYVVVVIAVIVYITLSANVKTLT